MGKQINYWMDYDSFLLLAQKAVDLGCTIVKENFDLKRVVESKDISIIIPACENAYNTRYYFHLSEAGCINTHIVNGREKLDYGFTATGNAVIEAAYSFIRNKSAGVCGVRQKKEITRARIYCITGYYDENGEYIPRPECLTKVYNALARYVKKIAPYTELTDKRISMKDENYGEKYEYKHKEYITKACLDLVNNQGYKLC